MKKNMYTGKYHTNVRASIQGIYASKTSDISYLKIPIHYLMQVGFCRAEYFYENINIHWHLLLFRDTDLRWLVEIVSGRSKGLFFFSVTW